MSCPHCGSAQTQEQAKKTSLGYRCSGCKVRPRDVTLLDGSYDGAVRWRSWAGGRAVVGVGWGKEGPKKKEGGPAMPCPHCGLSQTQEQEKKTSLGYRTFRCPPCRRRFNERSGPPFNDLSVA